MSSTSTRVQLIQCQIEIAKAMLLCGELVEYDAKWLKNAKTVVRDKTGRFASKAASIKEDAEAVVKTGGDILNLSADAISQMVKDPGFRERAGLSASAMMGKAIGNLVAQAKIFPGLEAQIAKLIKEQEKKLQDIYGKDNNALAQSFRKTKLPQPPKDASFKEKLEFHAARYKAYEDTLKNPQHRTTLDDVAAVGKAAVPIAAGLGLNLAIDLAVPLLLGNPLSLGALAAMSVASYAASEAASLGAKKLLDKTGLSDTQKMVADIAVRILAGAAVSGAASKVAGNIAAKKVEKEASELATKKAAEEAKLAAKKAREIAVKKAKESAEVTALKEAGMESDHAQRLTFREGKNWLDKNIDDPRGFTRKWISSNKETFRKKAAAAVAKAMENPLSQLEDPTVIQSIGKIELPPMSIQVNKSEVRAVEMYSFDGSERVNSLLRNGSIEPWGFSKRDRVLFQQGIGKKIAEGRLPENMDEMSADEVQKIFEEVISEMAEQVTLDAETICRALKRLPHLEDCPELSRFVDSEPVFNSLKPGDTFIEPGFMSCSTITEGAELFKGSAVKFKIKPKKVSTARDIRSMSLYPDQNEALYPPGAKFTVESVEMVDGKKIITMLEN